MAGEQPWVQYPQSSIETRPYWEAALRGELLFQRCKGCASVVFHPRAICPYCLGAEVSWERSAGKGKIYSFTVQHVPVRRDRVDAPPVVLGIIEMDEGYHMFSEIEAPEHSVLAIGLPVTVFFHSVAADLVLPKFRPAGITGPVPRS